MSFEDLTGRHVITPQGAVEVVSIPGVWGATSTQFDGGDWLDVSGNTDDLWFAAGDEFSVEFSIYPTELGYSIYDYSGAHQISLSELGHLRVWTEGTLCHESPAGVMTIGQPYWVEWSRSSGITRLFVNGAVVYSAADSRTYRKPAGDQPIMTIGGQRWLDVQPTQDVLGCLADYRITRVARHTAAYTPSAPVSGVTDPLWASTVLFLPMATPVSLAELAPAVAPLALRGDIKTFFFNANEAADYALSSLLLTADSGLTTAVILSLFTDARAQVDDAIPHGDSDRRGWWGDAFPVVAGDSLGSRLWLVWPGKQTPDNLLRARGFAEEALQWMVTDGVVRAVTVAASNPRDGLLALAITIEKPDGEALALRFESLWSL